MPWQEPFDTNGVQRDASGIKHYDRLPASVVEMLRTSVERDPDHEAVVELDGPRLSYRALWDSSARVAGGLRDAGVRRGDRVAIRHGNGVDWVRAFLGTVMAGGVAVPVNTRLAQPEIDHVIADCAAHTVLLPGSDLPDGAPFATEDLGHDDLAAIFYTSGTTGSPKGAMVSQENFLTSMENGIRVAGLPRADPTLRSLMSVPLFHVTACNSQLLPSLQEGGTTVIMPAFEVGRFLRALPDERIAVVTSAPAIYWYALRHPDIDKFDLSRVRWVTYGGAPMSPSLIRQIQQRFSNAELGNGFGLTETSAVSTFLPHQYALSHSDSVGYAVPTVDLALADADPDGVGELLIRGANVVSGYWAKPEQSTQALRDGWLHTGDLARIDSDGRVYIVDRIKDMINRGGENVYCVEVENVLAAAPGVLEVAVVAVPDEMLGEKVGAVIVPTPDQPLDPAAVLAFAEQRLADFKVPQFLRVQAEPLPRNPGGKVVKAALRQAGDWGPPLR